MASIKFDIRGDNSNFLRSLQGAQNGVQRSVSAIERAGGGMAGTFGKAKDSILGGFKQIAMGMAGITALLEGGGFLKGLISEMGEFNKAMREVSTLSKDVTDNLEAWKAKVVDLTTKIPIGATEAAKAMYQIESAGHHGADALNVLEESAKGAIGGVTETAQVADAITTILNSYNMSAEEATHVNDMLFTTVKLGKTNMQQLAGTIAQVAPVAATFGVSIEEVLAAVATLTKSGVKTSVAMRQVRDSIMATTKVLGDNAFEGKRFIDAMQEVADGTNGSNLELRKELSSLQALNGVLGMTGKNFKTAEKDLEDMQNSTGAAEEAYQKMADTASNSAQLLKNNIFKAMEPIGDSMIGFGKSLSDTLNEAFDSGAAQSMITALEAFAVTWGVYRAALIATSAAQSLNTAAMTAGYEAQIAELDKSIVMQEAKIEADLQEAVANGTLTTEQAVLITSLREEVAARQQQVMANAEAAVAHAEAAEAALVSATDEKAAADEMMIAAQERLAAAQATGVQSEISAAQEEVNTAAMMQNTAAANLNQATHARSVAVNQAATASKAAETTATIMETQAETANAVSGGVLASVKMALKRAQDALNASMFASPIFWIAAVIVGVTYAVYELVTAESAHDKAVRETNEALEEQQKLLEERKGKIGQLIRTIQDENTTNKQKIEAYDELKSLAPELTKEYSRQELATLDAAEAQKLLNENMDEVEYDEAKRKVEELRESISRYDERVQAAVKNAGQGAGEAARMITQQVEAEKGQLEVWEAKLQKLDELRAQAEEEAKPIELRIKEAEENAQVKQDIADFWDETALKIQELSEWHMNQSFDDSVANLDAYIEEVEKKLANLQTEIDKNPLDQGLQLKQSEGQKVLSTLQNMRAMWINSGATTLPLWFQIQLQGAEMLSKADADKAKQQVSNLNAQQKSGAGSGSGKGASGGKGGKGGKGGSGKTPKRHGGGGSHKPTQKEIDYDVAEIERSWSEKVADYKESIEEEHTDLMQEVTLSGTELEIAQIKEDTKRRKKDFEEKFDDMVKARQEADKKVWLKKNYGKKASDYVPAKTEEQYRQEVSVALGSDGGDYLSDINGYLDDIERRKIGDLQTEEANKAKKAWIDYFKTYGTNEEKRKAAEDEFNLEKERISKDMEISEEERQALQQSNLKAYEKAIRDLDFEDLKKSINWEYIFGDLEHVDTSTLDVVNKQLEEFIANAKDLSPDDMKTLTDAMSKIQERMDLSHPLQSIKEARKEYQAAKRDYDAYAKKLEQAKKKGDKKGEAEALEGMTKSSQKMTKAKNKEDKAFESVTGVVEDYSKALDEAGDIMGGAVGQCLKLAASAVSAGVGMANGIKAFGEAVSAMEKSVAILAIIEAALKAVQLIIQIFGSKPDVTLTNYVETLDTYIDLLSDTISELNEQMTDTKNTISDTIAYYEQLVAIQKDQAKAIKSQSEVWLNSGASSGFLGIGGSSSEGVKITKKIKESLKSSNAEVKKFYTDGYKNLNEYFKKVHGYYASSVDDFGRLAWLWSLSDEDLIALSKDTKALSLLGDELSEAIVKYAETLDSINKAQKDEFEALLNVSYDEFYDDFVSMVSEMDNTSADFANNFGEYMRSALIKSLIANTYKSKIEELYNRAGEWASDEEGLTQDRIDLLRKQYVDYANQAKADVNLIDSIVGAGQYSQQASSKGFAAMSQDTANELNARFTALQIAGENISSQIMFVVDYMASMTTLTTARNETLMEIRNMVFLSNGFLEDIAKYTKIASLFGEKIDKIVEQTKNI